MTTPAVSFVSPVYRNRESLRPLCERILAVAGRAWPGEAIEIVLVDDCSPDGAWAEIQALVAAMPQVRGVRLGTNAGQHLAVLAGFSRARGRVLICLDGDLQDPPEAAPDLVQALTEGGDVVFAGRRGRYQSPTAMLTSALYRTVILRLIGLPRDAGMYLACRGTSVGALLDARVAKPSVIGLIAATLRSHSLPVERDLRTIGVSSYNFSRRLAAARRALGTYFAARSGGADAPPIREQVAALIAEDTGAVA